MWRAVCSSITAPRLLRRATLTAPGCHLRFRTRLRRGKTAPRAALPAHNCRLPLRRTGLRAGFRVRSCRLLRRIAGPRAALPAHNCRLLLRRAGPRAALPAHSCRLLLRRTGLRAGYHVRRRHGSLRRLRGASLHPELEIMPERLAGNRSIRRPAARLRDQPMKGEAII